MIKKLKQKSGETLVETLFAMLIAVLSMSLLCSAVMAASNINMQTRELDEAYEDELNAVEGMDDSVKKSTNQSLVITFYPDGQSSYSVYTSEIDGSSVTIYAEDDGEFLSYDYNRGGTQ